jgi:ribosomal protein S18 acetylase RimI-like enzyme
MATLTAHEFPASVVPLTLRDVANLSISWRARMDDSDIRRALQAAPGASVWNPATAEYAIAAPWRHRDEVIQIADLAAIRHPDELVQGVAAAAGTRGALLTVMVEIDEKRPESFYARCGFEHLEQVVTYRIDTGLAPLVTRMPGLGFTSVHPFDEQTLATLIEIDHRAFPWLWWNSEAEFLHYAVGSGVELYIGFNGDTPVSYIGVTLADQWGHIDRIAVDPAFQGSGIGLQTLAATVESMRRRGVRTLGLSTQSTNQRSQQLYERFGFVRTRDSDYDLWGDTIHRAPNLDLQATEQPHSSLGR